MSAIDRLASLRVPPSGLGHALLFGIINRSADALSLAAAIEAAGFAVPWGGLLLVWGAGATATTVSRAPGGLGVALYRIMVLTRPPA